MTSKELDTLILEFLNGNKEKFDDIYYATEKNVYLSIFSIFKDYDIVKDLMQDTYIKALDQLDKYKVGTNFSAWIAKIARNIAINEYNRRKKVDYYEDITSPVFMEEDNNSKLKQMLDVVDDEYKDVVIYHIILGFKFREISEILDIPQSTVFVMYKNAIKQIKRRYDYE